MPRVSLVDFVNVMRTHAPLEMQLSVNVDEIGSQGGVLQPFGDGCLLVSGALLGHHACACRGGERGIRYGTLFCWGEIWDTKVWDTMLMG